MATLRRGGSVVAFTWNEDAAPGEHLAELQTRRFRSIERAASEEVSFGWVTPGDPTGDSFDLEDIAAGGSFWLRFRVDAKKFPASKMQMEVANAERLRGQRLSARQRRELKDHLHEQLLPTMLPRTQFVDVLVLGSLNRALLFATSKAARETFAKLVHESFGFVVNRCTSGFVALENVDEAGKLMPTAWPGRGPKQLELPGIQDFLGCEFLLWLWHGWETFGGTFSVVGVGEVGIAIDDRVEFSAASDETSLVLRHGLTARAAEARAALRAGRVPTKARLLIAEGSRQWTATIDGASLALTSVRGPDDSEECESSEDITADRASNWVALNMIVEQLFLRFVAIRSSDDWKKRAAEIGAWMGGGGA